MKTTQIQKEIEQIKKLKGAFKSRKPITDEDIHKVRKKVFKELEKEQMIKHFEKYFGKAKVKVSDEDLEKAREKVGKEILKECGLPQINI